MPAPAATTWLNYSGDRTAEAVGKVMGPNLLGEYLTVVDAVYDEATGKTRMGLAYGIHNLTEATS